LDYGTGINDLNAEDIESIEILKGAKATVLYGSQGLNGVVLITTKSGKKTRGLGVNVSHQISIEKPFTYIDFQNEYGSGTSTLDTATTVLPNGQRVRTLRATRFSFGPKFDGSQAMRYDSVMVPYKAYPDNWIDFRSRCFWKCQSLFFAC
jgi:iron complex outermembrane receptor protein